MERPPGLDRALSFRLTGLTPTEFAHEEAAAWNRAMQLQNAYAEGVASVRDKRKAEQAIAEMVKEG